MGTLKDIATPLIARGIPITPVRPNSKAAFLEGWQQSATTVPEIIAQWDSRFPGHNAACVAKAQLGGYWFFEVDSPEVCERILQETGNIMPATFRVRSRPGRGHFYFEQTLASIAMGNIAQNDGIKFGDWSARVNNEYVVAPGSIHPHSLQPYTVVNDGPIVEAPDWLVAWLISQKISAPKQPEIVKDERGLVPHGQIHGYMLREAGRLRALGLGPEAIEVALLELVHKNCAPPIDDNKVKTMAQSICNFPPGENTALILNQTPSTLPPADDEPLPEFEPVPYPKFPHYVMEGTSLYEKYVKPICAENSRIDYFMWLTAETMLLNYIAPKIKIREAFGLRPFRGSIYSVLIGQKGKTNKSSSVQDAMEYFNYAGCLQHASRDIKNADGKTLTWTVGSTEALGIGMQKSNCHNAILIYDELSQLVGKANIESSSVISHLLLMYESQKFENSIKSTKESFSINPDSYCTSLIACTTDKKFPELWSRLAGDDTGLNDRFMFIVQPETLPSPRPMKYITTAPGAIETKKLLDKAIMKGEYTVDTPDHPKMMELVNIDNRLAARAEKWAVAIAIDLGLDIIDDECIERGCAIVKYEIAAKEYLQSYEATTREGQIQQDIRRHLEMAGGRMAYRELLRKMHVDRFGTTLWNQAYGGLLKFGIIRQEGSGRKGDPMYVQLLVKRDVDDE
jgi:hypothetical protein